MRIGAAAQEAIEKKRAELEALAQEIWEHPETAYTETTAAGLTAGFLEKAGFSVEKGAGGVPTAIRAVWGQGHPVIGFLGEYDALPGLSQKAQTLQEAQLPGSPGHGCGHNLLAAATAGAVIGLKAEMEQLKIPGTIVFYGCPAEEVLTGKAFMAYGGCFRELDAALAWHPGRINRAVAARSCGCDGIKFQYHGVTAHAAFDPWNGRSALDAVQLLNTAVEYMREHVRPDVRIHYTITNGGTAPNIVPDEAEVWYFIRALNRGTIDEVRERLIQAAKGAAMMTGTSVDVRLLGGCYPMMGNHVLAEVLDQTMRQTPQEAWSSNELEFAQALNQKSRQQKLTICRENGLSTDLELHTGVAPISTETTFDSTDVGDVAHIVPTGFFMTATSNLGAPGHSWQVTACSGSSCGKKGMIYGAKVMAAAAAELMQNKELLEKARAEFKENMDGETYVCPITNKTERPF